MMISEKSLENFGHKAQHIEKQNLLSRLLKKAGQFTYSSAKPILIAALVIMLIAIYGITQIEINDNPVKWFAKSHPIRVADKVLNRHFGGTYMAYLVLDDAQPKNADTEYIDSVRKGLREKATQLQKEFPTANAVIDQMEELLLDNASTNNTRTQFLTNLAMITEEKEAAASAEAADVWYELTNFFELEAERLKIFKDPEVLRYISDLQIYLSGTGLVGKSNSISDIVKKVHQELIDGNERNYRIPDSSEAIAQCLMQFQSSHTGDDLQHFVTDPNYDSANLWLQLKSGDNRDMKKVVDAVTTFFENNPSPVPLSHDWAGLTYINVVWQEKMVWGMLQSFMGSFLVVFIMMAILFRSVLWGLICMVPLTITIGVIYGIIGLGGKDYDMPVAVLSALTLGMAVDFAIHFLERARATYSETGSWKDSAALMFGEPARAITRNVLVIAIGFLPLLAAPLMPYKTVGIFLCAIMALSGAVTLLVLPAIIRLLSRVLFKMVTQPPSVTCKCGFCIIISLATALLLAMNLRQYWKIGWNTLSVLSIIVVVVIVVVCRIMSRRRACKGSAGNPQK
jgi:predicted RND superfamily exporter protein